MEAQIRIKAHNVLITFVGYLNMQSKKEIARRQLAIKTAKKKKKKKKL